MRPELHACQNWEKHMTKTLDRAAMGGDRLSEHRERQDAGSRECVSEEFANNVPGCNSYCPQGGHQCAKPDGHEGEHRCDSSHSW